MPYLNTFNIIRVLVSIVVLLIAHQLIKKSKIRKKKRAFVFAILLHLILLTVESAFPTENLFINFKTPEQALHYIEAADVQGVVYGDSTCMVVYIDRTSSYGYQIIPKHNDSYKIPGAFSQKEILNQFNEEGTFDNGNFDIVHYKNTTDYYLFGVITSKAPQQKITGPDGESFEMLVFPWDEMDATNVIFYGTLDPQIVKAGEIELNINGNIVTLSP